MVRKGMNYVNRGKKKPSAVLPALAIVVVSLLVATVGAYAWQGLSGDDMKYAEKQELLRAARQKTESSSSASATETQAAPQTSAQAVEPVVQSGASSAPESSASTESTSVATPAWTALVPEGERVRSEYFDDAIFVGDSITDGIRSYELMQNATVIAFTGINPDSIRTKAFYRDANGNLLTALQALAQRPDAKKIYVMLGANSASWMDHDLFIQYYEEFLGKIVAQHPDALIYVQSITPINEAKFKQHYAGQDLTNAKILALNQDILKIAEKLQIYYINIADAVIGPDGQLPTEATSDGLHFSTTYYQKWFDYLKTHTAQPKQ